MRWGSAQFLLVEARRGHRGRAPAVGAEGRPGLRRRSAARPRGRDPRGRRDLADRVLTQLSILRGDVSFSVVAEYEARYSGLVDQIRRLHGNDPGDAGPRPWAEGAPAEDRPSSSSRARKSSRSQAGSSAPRKCGRDAQLTRCADRYLRRDAGVSLETSKASVRPMIAGLSSAIGRRIGQQRPFSRRLRHEETRPNLPAAPACAMDGGHPTVGCRKLRIRLRPGPPGSPVHGQVGGGLTAPPGRQFGER
jgi:hypothetical protein